MFKNTREAGETIRSFTAAMCPDVKVGAVTLTRGGRFTMINAAVEDEHVYVASAVGDLDLLGKYAGVLYGGKAGGAMAGTPKKATKMKGKK